MVIFLTLACQTTVWAQDESNTPKTVGGKTLSEWTKDLESTNEIVRLRAVKSLRPFGPASIKALHQSLADSSDAVQYWSADTLGAFGTDVLKYEQANLVVNRLEELAKKKEKAVSLAASFAVFQIRKAPSALSSIIEKVGHAERGMACSAAEFLGKIGPSAKAALPSLEKHFKDHKDYHVRGACQNAIREIRQQPVK